MNEEDNGEAPDVDTLCVESLPAPLPSACESRDAADRGYSVSAGALDLDGIHVVGVNAMGRAAVLQLRLDDVGGMVPYVPMHLVDVVARARSRAGNADVGCVVARPLDGDVVNATARSPFVVLVAALDDPSSAVAASVLARALRRNGDATVVAVCSEPPAVEHGAALARCLLAQHADTIITVPSTDRASRPAALSRILSLVLGPAEHTLVGVDIDEVRFIYAQGGRRAVAGWGAARGESRGRMAVAEAISALASAPSRARAFLGRIIGGVDVTLQETNDAIAALHAALGDVDFTCSAALDVSLRTELTVGILALGVDDVREVRPG